MGQAHAPAYTLRRNRTYRTSTMGRLRIMGTPAGRHFLQIPGPTNVPDRILRAIRTPDHGPPRTRFRAPRPAGAHGPARDLQDPQRRADLSVVRHRRVGGGAREHALARRHGADERDRALLVAVDGDGPQARPPRRSARRRLAHRRGSGAHRGTAHRRYTARYQGGRGRAQRDLHRGDEPNRRGARRARCRRPPGAAAGRYHFLARIHRPTATTSGAST